MSLIFNFLKSYYKIIIQLILVIIISYVGLYYFGKFNNNSTEYNQKIDSLNTIIKKVESEQKKLDSNIVSYNKEIITIDHNIEKIKSEKTTINNIYHEKINDVNNYTDNELDSFFAVRYGYIPKQ
jgi:exonuclease VII small subunit